MKTVRRSLVSVGVLLMFFALAPTGARSQTLYSTHFAGEFTIPFVAHWGHMILPPGDYQLYYGYLSNSGSYGVEIRGQAVQTPQGTFPVKGRDDTKVDENILVCVMRGDHAFVRELHLGEMGVSVQFARPHGIDVESWIVAGKKNPNAKTQLAETSISIKPVK